MFLRIIVLAISCCYCHAAYSQHIADSSWYHAKKNVVRYNISGALLFGFDKYVILGYERLINPHQSFSINVGGVKLPKFVSIITDSFQLNKDVKNRGWNVSVDYRFYLKKENKYIAPRGVYIGPYYSFNHFDRENKWDIKASPGESIITKTKFNIHTIGFELGYQFILWKRLAIDMVMVGPGISSYWLQAKIDGNISSDTREQLQDAVLQLIEQKFPGMNYVFADKEFKANGVLNTWSIGYRYMVHIGYNF